MSLMSGWLRRRVTWLTLCAVLFGAIAPAVAHGLATDKAWIDICSFGGTKRIALDTDSGQAPAQTMASGECPFCLLHNDIPTLPASEVSARFSDIPSAVVSCTVQDGLRHLQSLWSAHHSRAPPSFS